MPDAGPDAGSPLVAVEVRGPVSGKMLVRYICRLCQYAYAKPVIPSKIVDHLCDYHGWSAPTAVIAMQQAESEYRALVVERARGARDGLEAY